MSRRQTGADTAGQSATQLTAQMTDWLIAQGLRGTPATALLEAYCEKLVEMSVPLMRVHLTHNTLHPVYGAVGFDWEGRAQTAQHQYQHAVVAPDAWLVSPFYYMMQNGMLHYRERICDTTGPSRFPLLNQMCAAGATDYLAQLITYRDVQEGQPIDPDDGTEDGVAMSWMSYAEGGFSAADVALIRATVPPLALAVKAESFRKTAQDLLGVYLGRDAGQRVLSGEIQRGSSQWIDAVICYFDLAGFTSLSQRIEGEALIALLNDYFGVTVAEIEARGGDVLKFMGDGLIAIFDRAAWPDATARALAAVRALDAQMPQRNAARAAEGLPTLGYTVALHTGRVLYGNIGGDTRLDFTVIGPEVNLAARISGMHRALGRDIIVSHAVVRDAPEGTDTLISLGQYMLRGVDHPLELFTLYTG